MCVFYGCLLVSEESLYEKLFLLQNHSGGCICIGVIPEVFSNSRHLEEISSLESVSASCSVMTPSLTEHCVMWVSGAISTYWVFESETLPYSCIINDQ